MSIGPNDKLTIGEYSQIDPVFAEAARRYFERELNPSRARAEMPKTPTGEDEETPDNTRRRIVIRDAIYALQPQTPTEWRVENVISAGSLNLVVGSPASKKTYATMHMGVCVAAGRRWLDFDTQQTTVLFVDEESGERRMARRLGEVLRGEFLSDSPPPFKYVSLAQFNLREPGDAALLHGLITETGAGLVIIDALADIMPGADENSVKDVQPVFMRLRKIAEETQAAIVMIHHSNKAGDYRGSTAMSGAVDLMLMVESKDGSPNVDFETKKARDVEPFKFAAVAHFAEGQVWFTSSDPQKSGEKLGKSQRYVVRYLTEHGPSPLPEIMGAADSCTESAARQAIYALVDRKIVYRTNPEENGRGSVAIYALFEVENGVLESNGV